MSLKTRLAKLESAILAVTEPIQISIFLVAPGTEPKGYICDGVEVIQEPGESIEDLQKRCVDAVTWPDGNYRHVFYLLEEGECH
jgi:hypothetical protein